jgi:hypothetical protein
MKNKFLIRTILFLSFLGIRWWPVETLWAQAAPASPKGEIAPSVVFIGNSFTYGAGSPVQFYRAQTVTDLNGEGTGGVPALFKMFTAEAGRDFRVSLETAPGKNLDYHVKYKAAAIGKAWDYVVTQGYSTLDQANPGDPALLVRSARELAELLRSKNPKVDIRLVATWSRADQTYPESGHWHGQPIEKMALDIRAAYDLAAAAGAPAIHGVIPVGEAWNRAFKTGVADPNPYDGISAGQLDLWTYDHYHASAFGYYLEALMIFGDLTGLDPRSLGKSERSALELGFSPDQATALQQVAFDELTATKERPRLQSFQPVMPSSLDIGK